MATKGKKRRQLPAEEKLKILEEARQPNTTVAEVLASSPVGRGDVLPVGARGEGRSPRHVRQGTYRAARAYVNALSLELVARF